MHPEEVFDLFRTLTRSGEGIAFSCRMSDDMRHSPVMGLAAFNTSKNSFGILLLLEVCDLSDGKKMGFR